MSLPPFLKLISVLTCSCVLGNNLSQSPGPDIGWKGKWKAFGALSTGPLDKKTCFDLCAEGSDYCDDEYVNANNDEVGDSESLRKLITHLGYSLDHLKPSCKAGPAKPPRFGLQLAAPYQHSKRDCYFLKATKKMECQHYVGGNNEVGICNCQSPGAVCKNNPSCTPGGRCEYLGPSKCHLPDKNDPSVCTLPSLQPLTQSIYKHVKATKSQCNQICKDDPECIGYAWKETGVNPWAEDTEQECPLISDIDDQRVYRWEGSLCNEGGTKDCWGMSSAAFDTHLLVGCQATTTTTTTIYVSTTTPCPDHCQCFEDGTRACGVVPTNTPPINGGEECPQVAVANCQSSFEQRADEAAGSPAICDVVRTFEKCFETKSKKCADELVAPHKQKLDEARAAACASTCADHKLCLPTVCDTTAFVACNQKFFDDTVAGVKDPPMCDRLHTFSTCYDDLITGCSKSVQAQMHALIAGPLRLACKKSSDPTKNGQCVDHAVCTLEHPDGGPSDSEDPSDATTLPPSEATSPPIVTTTTVKPTDKPSPSPARRRRDIQPKTRRRRYTKPKTRRRRFTPTSRRRRFTVVDVESKMTTLGRQIGAVDQRVKVLESHHKE